MLYNYLFVFLNDTSGIKKEQTKIYCENLLEYWKVEASIDAKVKIVNDIEHA